MTFGHFNALEFKCLVAWVRNNPTQPPLESNTANCMMLILICSCAGIFRMNKQSHCGELQTIRYSPLCNIQISQNTSQNLNLSSFLSQLSLSLTGWPYRRISGTLMSISTRNSSGDGKSSKSARATSKRVKILWSLIKLLSLKLLFHTGELFTECHKMFLFSLKGWSCLWSQHGPSEERTS